MTASSRNVTAPLNAGVTKDPLTKESDFDVYGFPPEAALIGGSGLSGHRPEDQQAAQAPHEQSPCANRCSQCPYAFCAMPPLTGGHQ